MKWALIESWPDDNSNDMEIIVTEYSDYDELLKQLQSEDRYANGLTSFAVAVSDPDGNFNEEKLNKFKRTIVS